MISWISEWLYAIYSGPARNAPNNGVNIKKYIEQKPPDINTITSDDVKEAIDKLKPVVVIDKPLGYTYTSPLMAEFNTVFTMGYKNYFEKKKSQSSL